MNRAVVTALGLSASLLVAIAAHEGYRGDAYIPVAGDRPTIGFGDAGAAVRLGQRTDPVRALIRLQQQVDTHARGLATCLGDVPLHRHEWDAYVSWAYNVGIGAACGSTLVRRLRQRPPDYAGACAELLRWDKFQGRRLPGLTARRQAEHRQCMGAAE